MNNQTHLYMNGWFHYAKLFVALTGCIGFMMIKYKWGIDAKHWFKPFPFVIAAFCYILHVAKKRHTGPLQGRCVRQPEVLQGRYRPRG